MPAPNRWPSWLALAAVPAAFAQGDGLETIEVVGRAPLSLGQSVEGIASNVQAVTSEQIERQHALDFTDFIKRNLASVFVNEAQSNPLQPDVQYRGFVGSPLLGLPQGIAVYQDAVRINEPFGDTVNWALIPESAIATAFLMPGSNPLYGLNALGGAVAIETKNGFSHVGSSLELSAGSFGRASIVGESGGGDNGRFGYFVTGAYLEDDGWRDFSPTRALQVFGKLSWRIDKSSFDLSLTHADTDLIGNGSAPVDLLQIDRQQIFTRPDRTENELMQINFVGQHDVSDTILLTGNVYWRESDIDSLNGDDSDYAECQQAPGLLCLEDDAGEELVLDQSGQFVLADEALEGATLNRTRTRQDILGFGVQATIFGSVGERDNQMIVGLAFDQGDIGFGSSTELGSLDATRQAVPGGVYIGDAFTDLGAKSTNWGIYLSDSLTLTDRLTVTASARYNRIDARLADRLGTALNGDHRFSRINPALGFSFRWLPNVSIYGSYAESNRIPSPVELTCADPEAPCRLPNAFLADPPLEQVVAKTVEAGVRGGIGSVAWQTGVFRTVNHDDILFISAGARTNEGYFSNVGNTRRDGIEVNLTGVTANRAEWFVNYTHLDATFRSDFSVPSPNNPFSLAGEIAVMTGDRLPLIPRNLFKFGFRLPIGPRFTLGADMMAGSGQYLRGDEGNAADQTDGFEALNATVVYALTERIEVFAAAENILDEDYETFGVFGDPEDVLGAEFGNPRFLSPAAPRAAWIGIRIDL